MKARVHAEFAGFVFFILGGLLVLRWVSFPFDKTLWWIVFGAFVVTLIVEVCFISPFNHAKSLVKKIEAFEERMRPRIKVSGDMQTENCFIPSNDIFYFRARLDSLGTEPILNVEAHIIALRKEGASVPIGEYPQLMMHPGTPTLAALKYKVPGFIDVVKTDPQFDQPVLALAWDYASIDRWIIASGDTYEIDITISSINAPPKDFTFEFKWVNDAFQSMFEARDITQPSLVPVA